MNGEQIIPILPGPLGVEWRQPDRRYIELDETHALMSSQTFNELKDYSLSYPLGVCEGKMWKCNCDEYWKLMWYQKAPKDSFHQFFIDSRIILIQE